jgi:flagellar hook assembly protein FlgD
MLEFIVANSESMALQHVLNYPNPFTTNTTFHFDHNKAGEPIMVQVQVFTVSGKLIKTLQTETITSGNHFDEINWDGRDDFGDNIGKGVYIYKVKVKSNSGKSAEEYQKMVILN